MNPEVIKLMRFADLLIDVAQARPKGSMSRHHLTEAATEVLAGVREILIEDPRKTP